MSKKLQSVNFYQKMPKQYMEGAGRSYANHKNINIDIPFRMVIVGASGSGKTNT